MKPPRWHKTNTMRTICEVHREMHDCIVKGDYEALEPLLVDAYFMAKKMDMKLRQYSGNYDQGWYERQRDAILEEKKQFRGQFK